MIRYRLNCHKSHEFEAWFASSGAFDTQVKKKLVTCPVCGSAKVTKALMAPNVVTSEKAAKRGKSPKSETPAEPEAPPHPQLVANAESRELIARMRRLRDEVLAKSEYVGPRFAEEARRIHDEPGPPRGIHGEATTAEVKSLAEDGIDVYPVPVLPDDQN